MLGGCYAFCVVKDETRFKPLGRATDGHGHPPHKTTDQKAALGAFDS